MKRILLLSMLFCLGVTEAQQKTSTNDKKERDEDRYVSSFDSINRWSIDLNVGQAKGIRPFSPGYYSSETNVFWGKIQANHFNLGVRYMFSPIFGVKGTFGYDDLKRIKSNYSLPFEMQQMSFAFEGVVNAIRLFNAQKQLGRFGLLFHAGVEAARMTSKTADVATPRDHNYGIYEYNGGLLVGVTPEFRITKRLVFLLDVSVLNNYRQHFNWDGAYSDTDNNLSGQMVSASAGLSYAFGNHKNYHHDFNIIEKDDDNKINDLNDKVGKLEKMMADTDRDGVPDYLDAENNSVNGVAVDTKGRMIDLNKNGVPDELERGKDGMNGINSAIVSKEDAIQSLIEKGFVNIFYDVNKDEPNVGSTNNVYYLIKFLRSYPDAKATLTGYADVRGDEAANKDLSNRRAQKLLNIFKSSGIDASRINVTGEGVDKSFPETKIGLDLARRVSVSLK